MAGVRYVAKKLARAFNPISFSGVRYVDVVTCLVLVLCLSCSFHSSGGLTSMWRLRSSFMKNKAVARVLPSQKGLFWGVMQ